ncbi:MAG: hypothetical protein ACFE9I_04335 [Candidatus Hermodarchaeota archaeon]
MKKITDILTDLIENLKDDILQYYLKSHSYLIDLINYKKVDLNKKIEGENEKNINNTLKKMLKAIKTGLNTIGVSIEVLNKNEKHFLEQLNKENMVFVDYKSYFNFFFENYIYKILFEIIIDYLLEIEKKKLENASLFDLTPPNFTLKLNKIKNEYFDSSEIVNLFIDHNYADFINLSDLTIKFKKITESDILKQLREAKEDIIESLKTPKKDLSTPSIEKILPQKEVKVGIEEFSGTFLDSFGNFNAIHPEIIKNFKIDKVSLINSKIVDIGYFDLENLFYFISIIKMLDLEFPFNYNEIIDIMKNFINGKVFSSSKNNISDPKNIFYGLSIFSELDLFNKTNIVDIFEIEKYLKSYLADFIPEKLEMNLYALLSLKLMQKMSKILISKEMIKKLIYNLNVLNLQEFIPTFDMYNHLASIKLLDREANLHQFKSNYINEIKKLILSNGSVNEIISDSARALLIIDLLNLKEQESDLCSNLLNFIFNRIHFFDPENLNIDFNWRKDKLGYKLELRMLFWALLANSQYFTLIH